MSWSGDTTYVDDKTLRASRLRDIRKAFDAPTDLERSRWLEEALATTRELLRREAAPTRAAFESRARAIYESWSDQPGFVPWVEGGNSDKQEEARRIARAEK